MTLNLDDKQLITAAQTGDRTALNELLTRHWQPVYQFIAYKVGNQQDAQDIAQDTFLRAFRALPRYQEKNATFRTYLGRIALNLITDHWRRLGRAPQMVDVTDYRGLLETESEQPEEQLLDRERREEVSAALAKLPSDQRTVIEMRILTGLSIQETAAQMKKTEAAIKMLQQRALVNLRKLFQNNQQKAGDSHAEGTVAGRRTI